MRNAVRNFNSILGYTVFDIIPKSFEMKSLLNFPFCPFIMLTLIIFKQAIQLGNSHQQEMFCNSVFNTEVETPCYWIFG